MKNNMTIQEWQEMATSFSNNLQTTSWAIGDWLLYGEQFLKKRVTAEEYNKAVQATRLDITTLRSYASICRNIPQEERCNFLTFEHHKCLAPLKKELRQKWIEVATSGKIPSVKRLRMSVKHFRDTPKIIEEADIKSHVEKAGKENYIPHLVRLITILRKTLPQADNTQKQIIKKDIQELVNLVENY